MARFHITGWGSYTYRTDNQADIDTIVDADSEDEARSLALDEWTDDQFGILDDAEIEQHSLTLTRADDSAFPVWKEMEQAGAPTLFDFARTAA